MSFGGSIILVSLTSLGLSFACPVECQTFDRGALTTAWATTQKQSVPQPGQLAQISRLSVRVLVGADAVNDIGTHTERNLAVEVDDENDHPISGAIVTFLVPSQGAGGTFAHNKQFLTVVSDVNGRAGVSSFRPNGVTGNFKIEVTVTYGNQEASTYISQSNEMVATGPVVKNRSGKKIILLAVGGIAAAAILGVELSHGGGSSSSSSAAAQTATLGLGSGVTVGPLH